MNSSVLFIVITVHLQSSTAMEMVKSARPNTVTMIMTTTVTMTVTVIMTMTMTMTMAVHDRDGDRDHDRADENNWDEPYPAICS